MLQPSLSPGMVSVATPDFLSSNANSEFMQTYFNDVGTKLIDKKKSVVYSLRVIEQNAKSVATISSLPQSH